MKKSNFGIAIIVGIITFLVYLLFNTGEQKHLNYFVPLADAFLQGRLYLIDNPPWLNELIPINNQFFVVYPPMPAILLMPFVYIFGIDFSQPLLSIIIGSINVSLSFLVINKLFHSKKIALSIAVIYGFGSMQFYHSVMGSAWYIAHIIAMFFIWLMLLNLQSKRKNYLVIGLLIGCAYWSRLPAILAVVFPLLYFWEDFVQLKPKLVIHFKSIFLLGLGIGVFVLLNAFYNYLRFGVPYDISYQLLPVFEEPWYKHGLFNVVNIPIHLKEILFALPSFSPNFPYIIPSLNVMAIWFVMPSIFLAFFAPIKKRIVWTSVVTILIMSLPGLMHGSNGFSQFGFRFSLDYLPFLLLVIAAGIHKKIWPLVLVLILLGTIINVLGIIAITIFKLWTI